MPIPAILRFKWIFVSDWAHRDLLLARCRAPYVGRRRMSSIPFVLQHAIGKPDADARGDEAAYTHDDAY